MVQNIAIESFERSHTVRAMMSRRCRLAMARQTASTETACTSRHVRDATASDPEEKIAHLNAERLLGLGQSKRLGAAAQVG
jgi:hypothetical protein